MKSSTMNLLLATAALGVASTVASAHSIMAPVPTMRAEIPFAFLARGKMLPPGTYTLKSFNGESLFQLTNVESREGLLLTSGIRHDPQRAWEAAGHGILQFECFDGGCALREIWTHQGAQAHKFTDSNKEKEKPVRLAVIRIALPNAK